MSKKNKRESAEQGKEQELSAQAEETVQTEETADTPVSEDIAPEQEPVQEETPAEERVPKDTAVEPAAQSSGEAGGEVSGESSVGTVIRPVNFRTGASFANAVIADLKPGTVVTLSGTVEGDKGTWYKCEFDGRTGYIKASGVSTK